MWIDANIILRHVLQDDKALAAKAEQILAPIKTGERPAIIVHAVLAECVYILDRKIGVAADRIAMVLSGVLKYRGFVGERIDVAERALAHFGSTPLSFVDSLLLALAETDGTKLATLDRDLYKIAARRNLV